MLFGSTGVKVPEASCSSVSGRASATEWLRFVLDEGVADVTSLSALPGSFVLVGVSVAVAAIVLVPIGPAGIAASATGSWGLTSVDEAGAANGDVDLVLDNLAVVGCTGVCISD